MPYEFKARRRVEFSDTDMAGIMHFSNFFRFIETAEHGFYRSLGFSVVMPETDPRLGWPRVHAACDYHRPLRFEDEVELRLVVKERRTKAIDYIVTFTRVHPEPVVEVARASLTIVCVAHLPDGHMKAMAIPPEIGKLIEPAPAEVMAELEVTRARQPR